VSAKIAIVLGTRPEMIKLAPVIRRLGESALVVHTGQHFDSNMSQSFLDQLQIGTPQLHLEVGGATRGAQIGRATEAIERFLMDEHPAVVVVQGDTNSGLAGALAANSTGTPLAHLEAGLRSYDRAMPEEHNRVVIDALADLCLAPHESNAQVLQREGIPASRIRVTGSTLLDALAMIVPTSAERAELIGLYNVDTAEFVLATIHRAENADNPDNLRAILSALVALPVPVVVPLHPRTRKKAAEFGLQPLLDQLVVCEPIGYREFIGLATESALIISDSGGVQEEATIVKRPVIIVRNSTERPEILGTFAHLVSPGPEIGVLARTLLDGGAALRAQLEALPYPYGSDATSAVVAAINELSG
jgi:UDP-N-acetylglucosamine 2-epimerase (non-hydrolysing)